MVCIGTGPGPKNVLGTDGVVYPYAKFKALRGKPVVQQDFATRLAGFFPGSEWLESCPSPASTALVDRSDDQPPSSPLPSGSARGNTVAVVGGSEYDEAELEKFARKLPKRTTVVTGNGQGAEKALRDVLSDRGVRVDVPTPLSISNALERQIELVLSMTQDSRAPVVLIGRGGRVKYARSWLKRCDWKREVREIP